MRDIPVVAEVVARDADRCAIATRALLRVAPAPAVEALRQALVTASSYGAARVATALGRLARSSPGTPAAAEAIACLVQLLHETSPHGPRATRAAITTLGKIGGPDATAALRALVGRREMPAAEKRALIEALGKLSVDPSSVVGDDAAAGDVALARVRDRAEIIAARERERGEPSSIRADVAIGARYCVTCRCRAGLEDLLAADLATWGMSVTDVRHGMVRVLGDVELDRFQASRLWTSLGIELRCVVSYTMAKEEFSNRVADALTAPVARNVFERLTAGRVRWRLELPATGHRRALVWATARKVRDAAPDLVNDPAETTWDVVVIEDDERIELRPRRLEDRRFRWKVTDVPAASHPTVAAALAMMSSPRHDDVVWDPFCGSGSELVERALRAPCRSLLGTDVDPRALGAARANLAAAGVQADLVLADATAHDPGYVTSIITNPPLGRRLRGDPLDVLERLLARAARHLVPGGRLAWITPHAARTERAGRAAGLRLDDRRRVDLGGFDGHLERWIR